MKNVSKADERLRMVASLVKQGGTLLDIGTDHAYLPVYLIKSGACQTAVASDVVEGPLEAARKTVESKGLSDKIKLYISNGFDSVPENCADNVVIAGMGGILITEILSRCTWIKAKGIRLVLQPMTYAQSVREFLFNNGFEIIKEQACYCDGHYYCAICAEYTGNNTEYEPADCYIGKLYQADWDKNAAIEIIRKQHRKICVRLEAIKNRANAKEEYELLKKISEKTEKYI